MRPPLHASLPAIARRLGWLLVGAAVAVGGTMAVQPHSHTVVPRGAGRHAVANADLTVLTSANEEVMTLPAEPGIKGESTVNVPGGNPDVAGIDLNSISGGASNTASTSASGGAVAGKAHFNDLVVTHAYDRASPGLLQALAQGQDLGTVKIFVLQPTSSRVPRVLLAITLGDTRLTQVQHALQPGSHGDETISLAYQAIRYDYYLYPASGGKVLSESMCWNVAANSADCALPKPGIPTS